MARENYDEVLWYRVIYSYIDHDLPASERTGDEWTEKIESSGVPSDIPDPAPELEETV